MPGRNGRAVLRQLITAYQEEAQLYAALEADATEQRHLLLNGRDPGRLGELAEHQRRLAEDIGRIETAIAPLRTYWEQMRDRSHGSGVRELARQLDDLLDALTERIHVIVEIERANSDALLAAVTPPGIWP